MATLDGQTTQLEKTTSQMCNFSELSVGHLYYTSDVDGDVCMKISLNDSSNCFNFEDNEIQTQGSSDTVFKSKLRYIKGEW